VGSMTTQSDSGRLPLSQLEKTSLQAGRLYVPPAYIQTSGDTPVALLSNNHKAAFGFTPEIDFALFALSIYLNSVAVAGQVTISLHADDRVGIHSDGRFNGTLINSAPTMTSNNAPSPYAVAATNEASGFEAFKAMDNSTGADNGWRSTAAPSGGAPISWVLDTSTGLIINKYRFVSFNNASADVRAFPKAWTVWGSNLAAPNKDNDADWTSITMASPATVETDPGAASSREYYLNNAVNYRWYRWKFSDRNGVNTYVALGSIYLYAAQSKPQPGNLLAEFGSSSAESAGWIRHQVANFQLQRGKRYWLQFSGENAKSFSLSARRWNTNPGSMFPDHVMREDGIALITSSNNGATWTECTQDGKPAFLNFVLNSTPAHSPQVHYGQYRGAHEYLPGGFMVPIPEAAIIYNCESLIDHTTYGVNDPQYRKAHEVYLYNDVDGLMKLEVTASASRIVFDGIEVKSGATDRKFVGLCYPIQRHSGKQAPIDVMDWRGICSRGRRVIFGKKNPYSAGTYSAVSNYVWAPWVNDSDWKVSFLTLENSEIDLTTKILASSSNVNMGLSIDGELLRNDQSSFSGCYNAGYVDMASRKIVRLGEGFHFTIPMIRAGHQNTGSVYFYNTAYPFPQAEIVGKLEVS
jgi:hypothetical protein